MLVRNRLPNHAYHGDEAFAGDSVCLGLGQRLNFIFKKGTFGAKSPLMSKILFEQGAIAGQQYRATEDVSKAKFEQVLL